MSNSNELRAELDSLQGNINRMCITTDEKELQEMRKWAKLRIDKIFDYRQEQIRKKVKNGTRKKL